MDPATLAAYLKFGELGLAGMALFGAYKLLARLPKQIGHEVGQAMGVELAKAELRLSDRLADLEMSIRGFDPPTPTGRRRRRRADAPEPLPANEE